VDGKRAVLALLLTFVVACGGASPASSNGAGASAGAGNGTAGATGGGSPATAQPGTNSSQPKLLELLSAAKLTSYKVTYKLTATGAGSSFGGEQSWYFKPPKARFDFGMDVGGQKTTISFFSLPEGSYYCFGSGGTSQCLSIKGVGSPLDQNLAASFQQSLVNNPDQYGGTYTGTKTIAGQQGLCYDVKAVATVATGLSAGSFCYSKEGIALLQQFSASGSSWSMEATNVSTTVPDSDFTLPSKPVN
jgi:hypothetical protein